MKFKNDHGLNLISKIKGNQLFGLNSESIWNSSIFASSFKKIFAENMCENSDSQILSWNAPVATNVLPGLRKNSGLSLIMGSLELSYAG